MQLFSSLTGPRALTLPEEARHLAALAQSASGDSSSLIPRVDERMLAVYERANDPSDALELRDLWLGRVEHELGVHSHRPALAARWRAARTQRRVVPEEVLASRSTVRLVKELFNWFFREDLYGDLRSDSNLLLSGGSVDEAAWGLPAALKDCIGHALQRDWYGYSDSRGRGPALEAIAAYESARIDGPGYEARNVAVTMGATSAISSLADFLLAGVPSGAAALCGIPNYPPLVESIARRRSVQLVPLASTSGYLSLEPLIASLTPDTPLVMLQTAANPTGAVVRESELVHLIEAASPSTIIILDECHEWLGATERFSRARSARNVIRVSSVSKAWSAPGLKIGWILADDRLVSDYYEYASTTFGGPPSFFYTLIEVLARMERWLITGVEQIDQAALAEFEASYGLDQSALQRAYDSYRAERAQREAALTTLRSAAIAGLSRASASVMPVRCSINLALTFPGWNDSYRCFRDLLRETGVAVFPGILNFCFSGGVVRVTSSRQWSDLSRAISRLETGIERARPPVAAVPPRAVPGRAPDPWLSSLAS